MKYDSLFFSFPEEVGLRLKYFGLDGFDGFLVAHNPKYLKEAYYNSTQQPDH